MVMTALQARPEQVATRRIRQVLCRVSRARRWRVPLRAGEPHPAQQILKPRLIIQLFDDRSGEAEHLERALVVHLFQPFERLVLLPEPEVDDGEAVGRDVSLCGYFLQLRQNRQRIAPSSRESVPITEPLEMGPAGRKRHSPFERDDRSSQVALSGGDDADSTYTRERSGLISRVFVNCSIASSYRLRRHSAVASSTLITAESGLQIAGAPHRNEGFFVPTERHQVDGMGAVAFRVIWIQCRLRLNPSRRPPTSSDSGRARRRARRELRPASSSARALRAAASALGMLSRGAARPCKSNVRYVSASPEKAGAYAGSWRSPCRNVRPLSISIRRPGAPVKAPLRSLVVRAGMDADSGQAAPLLRPHLDLHGGRNGARHVRLQREHVGERTLVGLRPPVAVGTRRQSAWHRPARVRRTARPIPPPPHRRSIRGRSPTAASSCPCSDGRCPRDHRSARDLREIGRQGLRHAIDEVILLGSPVRFSNGRTTGDLIFVGAGTRPKLRNSRSRHAPTVSSRTIRAARATAPLQAHRVRRRCGLIAGTSAVTMSGITLGVSYRARKR